MSMLSASNPPRFFTVDFLFWYTKTLNPSGGMVNIQPSLNLKAAGPHMLCVVFTVLGLKLLNRIVAFPVRPEPQTSEVFNLVLYLCFQSQYCNGGDLADYLHGKHVKQFLLTFFEQTFMLLHKLQTVGFTLISQYYRKSSNKDRDSIRGQASDSSRGRGRYGQIKAGPRIQAGGKKRYR